MSSVFGDVDDLFNDNIASEDLPGDIDQENYDDNLFGEEQNEKPDDETEQGVKVAPKRRAVRNPRPRLTVETLTGPRGIHTIEDYYKDIKFKGKGYEKNDLDEILRRLQHWAHRMYPTYKFDDVLNNIERLGKKKTLQVHMSRYRLGMLEQIKAYHAGLGNIADADAEEGVGNEEAIDEPYDEFDALLGEQIAMSKLAPRTPAHSIHQKQQFNSSAISNNTFVTPSFSKNVIMSTPYTHGGAHLDDTNDYAQPLPMSQPSTPAATEKKQLSAEQMARIAENRRLAQERLRAKQMQPQ